MSNARIIERRQMLAGAEMAALCALLARRGLPSPYGGDGWSDGADERAVEAFEAAALGLMEQAAALEPGMSDAAADTIVAGRDVGRGGVRMSKRADSEYRRWYERGWRYSSRGTATLDHGDAIGAPDAWYDGYLDLAGGREKWHLATCSGCPEHPAREMSS